MPVKNTSVWRVISRSYPFKEPKKKGEESKDNIDHKRAEQNKQFQKRIVWNGLDKAKSMRNIQIS